MKRIENGLLMGLTAFVALSWAGAAQSQSVEEFYKGKAVNLVVSAPAGTLSDALARQFGEYFAKHLPGQPDIVVMNVPGAGGMVAAAKLQKNQPRDGTVIGFQQRNNLYRPLVDGEHEKFDPREVNWIGSLNKVYYTIVAMNTAAVQTAEDMFKKPLILGATGYANENRTLPAMMNKYLGTKFDIVHGYSGRKDVYLAMERGEVEGWLPTVAGLLRGTPAQQIKEGKLKVLMQMGWKNHPAFPDVPNFSNYVKDPKVKAMIDFFTMPFEAGRPLAVPKGVPEDRLAALRDAFEATMKDPEFIALMDKRNSPIDPISGKEIEDIIHALYATPEDVLANVREILKPKS